VANGSWVRLIPLGGLGEVGLNVTCLETAEDCVVLDAGLMFPEEDMLGIDLVIPEFTALLERRERLRAVVLTHGHEDHTGALPYLLRELPVPVYGTRLTLALARERLREAGVEAAADLRTVTPDDRLDFGALRLEFLRVCHSIPDGVAVAARTPAGLVVHTGDFKFDPTPVDGVQTDEARFAALGDEGVLALLSDSTNALREGSTPSERSVGQALRPLFARAPRRIIVACFASNIHRIQQVLDTAAALGRRVAVNGKSMLANTRIAAELGYLQVPPDALIRLEDLKSLPAERTVILTTGSQGEPLSALARMAAGEHKHLEVQPGDLVIFSARVIPGNERAIARTIDALLRRGAEVLTEEDGVHVSGHPGREELRRMLRLTRPRFLLPVHGEYRHRYAHARLAEANGLAPDRVLLAENGDVLEFAEGAARTVGKAAAGRVFVDGKGVGDVGDTVLRDRQHLAEAGVVIVAVGVDGAGGVTAGPEILARGFAHEGEEAEALFAEARGLVAEALQASSPDERADQALIAQRIRSVMRRFVQKAVDRRPTVVCIVLNTETAGGSTLDAGR
jgi:ribonuclease J